MDQKIIEILDKNEKYCSHGDTVNYADPPKVFENCDGSFLFDEKGTATEVITDVKTKKHTEQILK